MITSVYKAIHPQTGIISILINTENNGLNMEKQQLKLLPKVGEYYHFFDDGKCSPGRYYICRIERILTLEEAKSIKLTIKNELGEFVEHSLYFIWLTERDGHDWVYAKETDFILEVSCPTYDDNLLYAARTKWRGWFTMDIQSEWQGGDVDVDGSKMKDIQERYADNPEFLSYYPEANEENYLKRFNV